jgi:hypothetical protein
LANLTDAEHQIRLLRFSAEAPESSRGEAGLVFTEAGIRRDTP